MAPTRRRRKARISCPPGRLPGRNSAVTKRPSPPAFAGAGLNTTNRLKAIIVVVGVEQAQLLPAMHPVESVVDIEHDTLRHLPERGAVLLDQRAPEAQQ